MQNRSI